MKIVYIVRHAKSSWEDPNLPDRFRKLLPLGEERTLKVARHLRAKFVNPELIITSSASRALETAKIIAKELHYPMDQLNINSEFYRADRDEIIEMLNDLPDEVDSAMIIGHNPTLTNLVNSLLEPENRIGNLPTSAVAAFRFKTDHWLELDTVKHHMEFLVTPKSL